MKNKILFVTMLLCLALTACGKDDPLEVTEATQAETKSKFDISEDYETFINESLSTPNSALSIMNEEARLTIETEQETTEEVEETGENNNLEPSQSDFIASTEIKELSQTGNLNLDIKVEEMPQELKEAIEAQNNQEVKEGLDIISTYLETLENDN